MPNSDLHLLTITDAARLIERRRLPPFEVTPYAEYAQLQPE